MTARATDALAVRNIIADDFKHHSLMKITTSGMIESQFRSMGALRNDPVRTAGWVTEAIQDTIVGGRVFWINRDMQTLAVAAAEKMGPEDTVFRFPYTPSHHGLLVFAEPLTGLDIRGRTTRTHAVSWSKINSKQLVLGFWVHKYDMMDDANRRIRAENGGTNFDVLPEYEVWHTVILEHDAMIPRGMTLENGTILPVDIPLVVDGKGGIIDLPKAYLAEEFSNDQDPVAKIMLSIWHLMNQTVSDVREEHAPRPLARASKRLDLIPLVSVIVLRQAKKTYLGTGTVEWSHRWLRDGHWRNQWYKDEDKQWRQRPVYIHQQVCGPEDKPLVIKDKVTALVR